MFIPIEFQKAFQKTRQTAIAISAQYTDSPAVTASRFGGKPYWEAGVAIPLDVDNKPMVLLAQINFSQLPPHDELPKSGLLQLFIPTDDPNYGANMDEVGGSDDVFIQFWQAPDSQRAIQWPHEAHEADLIPVFGAHALTFTTQDDYAGIDTIECAEAMGANPFEVLEDVALNEKEENQFFENLSDYVSAYGHKILGSPGFVQGDPRDSSEYRLLLQIDTDMDDDNDIIWGDNGIGHVFIRHDDLRAGRFDRLWLFWEN